MCVGCVSACVCVCVGCMPAYVCQVCDGLMDGSQRNSFDSPLGTVGWWGVGLALSEVVPGGPYVWPPPGANHARGGVTVGNGDGVGDRPPAVCCSGPRWPPSPSSLPSLPLPVTLHPISNHLSHINGAFALHPRLSFWFVHAVRTFVSVFLCMHVSV